MRVASRHMPKFNQRPAGIGAWLLVACFLAAAAYVAITKPLVTLVVASGLAVLYGFASREGKRQARKLRTLADRRAGQSLCDFARDFDPRAVDTWIIRATYEQLQLQLKHIHPSFPVRADDRLKDDLMLDDDDLDMDVAPAVEERTGRPVADTANNPYHGKVKTVRDLVLFFQHQPRSGKAA